MVKPSSQLSVKSHLPPAALSRPSPTIEGRRRRRRSAEPRRRLRGADGSRDPRSDKSASGACGLLDACSRNNSPQDKHRGALGQGSRLRQSTSLAFWLASTERRLRGFSESDADEVQRCRIASTTCRRRTGTGQSPGRRSKLIMEGNAPNRWANGPVVRPDGKQLSVARSWSRNSSAPKMARRRCRR